MWVLRENRVGWVWKMRKQRSRPVQCMWQIPQTVITTMRQRSAMLEQPQEGHRMSLLRFKEKFIPYIRNPILVEGLKVYYKTKTSRPTERDCKEYEVVYGIKPNPLLFTMRTGIIVEITDAEHKSICDYSDVDLACDVNHCDKDEFLRTLNIINGKKFTMESDLYLHTFILKRIEMDDDREEKNKLTVKKAQKRIMERESKNKINI